jgi:tryptophan halogenase
MCSCGKSAPITGPSVCNENSVTEARAPHSLQRIVIAGDGLAAWMAAAALARAVRLDDYAICVVGTGGEEDHVSFGGADATLPLPSGCHAALELDENRLVAETGATFTCGIALSGWAAPGVTYFHPFGPIGANLGPVPFHHLVMRLRSEGVPLRLANYSLAALAAQAGRFARPGKDARSVLSTCRYGLHVDCTKLAGMLRTAALAAGIRLVSGLLQRVEYANDGAVGAVITNDGERLEGDLFLDCTGTEARLIGTANDAGWEDWSAWLPCDRVLSARFGSALSPPPYSHAEANHAGWIRHLPLQGEAVLTAFYCGAFVSDDEAVRKLRESSGDGDLGAVRFISPRFGRRNKAWHHNCIALGSAAGFIDPVATSNLALLRAAIDRLLKLLPGDRVATAEAAEYNRQTSMHLDRARDFAVLHYKLNGRRGERLWDAFRETTVPALLDYKMRLYQSRGRVAMYDEEPVDEMSWINLFDEHGVRPHHYSPIADGFSAAELEAHVERARTIMIDELKKMPLHADYLSGLRRGGA